MNMKPLLFPLVAALLALTPATSLADRKVKVYRDLDGDGHYNKKTYETHRHRDYRSGYYGRYRGYDQGYYRYGSPYRYGYGYGYGYPRTSLGVSVYSRPVYTGRTVSRGYTYSDSLASDVQRALKRRGYYHGSVDGDIGSGSRAAIRAYQRDRGLAITGRIDSSLVRSLDVR